MAEIHCPGQDQRYWKPEDIFNVICPSCGHEIEFWKDEAMRTCGKCTKPVRNPRLDLGCAKWCKQAKECLGLLANPASTAPVEKTPDGSASLAK